MRMIPSPDTFRLESGDLGTWMCEQISLQINDMRRHGIKFAGVLFDSIFSSDGVIPGTPGFLKRVVDLVHAEGGLYIADEVQPGFCRTGDAFWGFARHGITPDIVLDQSDYYKLRPYLLNEENDIQIQAAKKELLKIIEGVN